MQETGNKHISDNPYQLSIRLQSDGFSLSIRNEEKSVLSTKNGKILFQKLNEEEITVEFRQQFETEINYNAVEITLENDFYTLVPDLFGETDDNLTLLKFQHPDFDTKENIVLNKMIGNLKTNLIFGCPTKIVNAIKKVFSNYQLSHTIVEFLNLVNGANGVFMSMRGSKMDIAIISDNSLLVANTYAFSSNEDVLYHLLNVMYTLKLQADKHQLNIFSNQDHPELQKLLIKHIPNTTFLQLNNLNQ